jgi:hypothetical protein
MGDTLKTITGEYVLVRKDLTRENHEEEICRFTNKDWAGVGRNLFNDELGGKYNDFFIRYTEAVKTNHE